VFSQKEDLQPQRLDLIPVYDLVLAKDGAKVTELLFTEDSIFQARANGAIEIHQFRKSSAFADEDGDNRADLYATMSDGQTNIYRDVDQDGMRTPSRSPPTTASRSS
jgi:hypothetical protein